MPSMLDGQRSPIGSLAKLGDGVRANSDAKTQAGLGRGAGQSKKLVNAAWTQTFPAQGATLDLDFANDRGYVRGVGQGRSMDAVTFTRASNGTFVKPDGTLSQHSNQGALGNNLFTFPQDFNDAIWIKANATVAVNVWPAPDGTTSADQLIEDTATNYHRVYRNITNTVGLNNTVSLYARKNDGRYLCINSYTGASVYCYAMFDLQDGVVSASGVLGATFAIVSTSIVDANNGWWRCVITFSNSAVNGNLETNFSLSNDGTITDRGMKSYTGTGQSIFIWGAQLELGSTATEYFPTNINVPRFDWASTASTGAGTIASPFVIPLLANSTSNGLLIEESRANRILWCRDATQTNWVKLNVTAAKDQTGVDGVASSASSLTATLANGTCIQTITLSSGSRTGSVFLKRITGTGNIQVTLDGTTYSTVDLSNGLWNRIVISATVLNPTVGIRIVTSGDAVAMDFGQVEDGAFVTSPIMTTTATVTRSADVASMTGNNFDNFYNLGSGTLFAEGEARGINSQVGLVSINNNTVNNNFFYINHQATIGSIRSSITNSSGVTQVALTIQAGAYAKCAFAAQQDNFASSANGSTTLIDTGGIMPSPNQITIGSPRIASIISAQTLKKITYFPFRLKDSILQELTR